MADDDNVDDPSEARDFVMARLGAARAHVSNAADDIDAALQLFVSPGDDPDGKGRADMLETADDALGEAARAIQAGQEVYPGINPTEAEADLPEDDGHDAEGDEAVDGG